MSSPTSSSSCATFHSYTNSLSASALEVFVGRGNLYGFLVENNTASDIFLQVFDAASAASVTVGTTAPVFTVRIPGSSAFGKDADDMSYKFLGNGCVVAVTTTRTGNTAPATAATAQFWFVNRQP